LSGVVRIAVPNDAGLERLRDALDVVSPWIHSLTEQQGAS
jgi:hypothetical protein